MRLQIEEWRRKADRKKREEQNKTFKWCVRSLGIGSFWWVRGLMAINVGCELRGRGSIPSVCQITDAELG